MKLITERTESILSRATLPDGAKSFLVPDSHGCMDKEQQEITSAFKAAFGTEAAESTFKVAIDKKGERQIYEPCVMAKDGKVVIDWGGKTYPLGTVEFSAISCLVKVEIDDSEYTLKVRTINVKKEDAKGKVQIAWASCTTPIEKMEFLNKAWAKGTIVEILAQAFPTVHKLSEVVGQHVVNSYYMGGFDKYVLVLADGRNVRANTALQLKLAGYEEMGIEVSPECPAQLTVEPSKGKTSTGFDIFPVTLVSHRNIDLPVFDFGFSSGSVTTAEAKAFDALHVAF